jgi:site-specific DNA recombinase
MFSDDDSKNDAEFKKRMNEEDEKEKIITKELNEMSSTSTSPIDSNPEIWADLKENWPYMTVEIKKQFVLIAVDHITVDKINKDKTPDSIEIKEVSLH